MLMLIDICVQDPLNEGAWWHSACDTATSHLWVSQRLRLHRRGLNNIQENHFDRMRSWQHWNWHWQHWQDEVLTTFRKIILTRGPFLSDGVCGGCDAGDQHHSKPWCHRCKVCSMFIKSDLNLNHAVQNAWIFCCKQIVGYGKAQFLLQLIQTIPLKKTRKANQWNL